MKAKKDNNDKVMGFMGSCEQLKEYFGCSVGFDFFLKPLVDFEWAIRCDDEFNFLSYWGKDGNKVEAVVVKKDGEPLVYRQDEYSMVMAIDCVKTGFIFRNNMETAKK